MVEPALLSAGGSVGWWLLEAFIVLFPSALNIPGFKESERRTLSGVPLEKVRAEIAPVCIAAGYGMALSGALLAVVHTAIGPSLALPLPVVLLPIFPLVVGAPLFAILGRLQSLATTANTSETRS